MDAKRFTEEETMSYDETMNAAQEMFALGYSVDEVIYSLENSESDMIALEELKHAQKFGV